MRHRFYFILRYFLFLHINIRTFIPLRTGLMLSRTILPIKLGQLNLAVEKMPSSKNPASTSFCFQLTISLSLTTISSIYLVSVCTEGLRTYLLDRFSPPDTCCSLTWSGPSSPPSPPLLSHSSSSGQSGHTEKQNCECFLRYEKGAVQTFLSQLKSKR